MVHKNSISDNDWSLIKTYFSDNAGYQKLTQYVWFETSLHFCLHGSEAQSQLKTSDLVFSTIAGEDAITLNADFMSKNHRGGLSGSATETAGAIVNAYTISVFRRYLAKLNPECPRLFQRAKYGSSIAATDSQTWFMESPLGHNTLGKFLFDKLKMKFE